jgi:ribosomal protein L12E/L44/L45/RPP1/RPP2
MSESKALTIVKEHEKAKDLVFVKPEDLQTQKMFVPQVTVIHATPDDFHDIKGGKKMPKSHHTDRIGEAAGVTFIAENCTVEKIDKYVWVGRAQGQRRMPDGTLRKSSVCEYEFDAELRAEESALSKPDKYKTDAQKRQLLIEFAKFGRQRAATGARLKVIRELTGIPTAFSPQDIHRAFVVSRIAVNTDEMLNNPEMRQAAIAHATGASQQIFGPQNGNQDQAQIEAPQDETAITESEEGADIFDDEQGEEDKPDPRETLKAELGKWLDYDDSGNIHLSEKSRKTIEVAIDNPEITEEDLEDMLQKVKNYFSEKEDAS